MQNGELDGYQARLFVMMIGTNNGRDSVEAVVNGIAAIVKEIKTKQPQAKILLSNLPGYPDNLTRGTGGRIWLGLVKPRGAAVDKLSTQPLLRKVVMRLPRSLWPIPPAYGHVIAFDETSVVHPDPEGQRQTEVLVLDVHPVQVRLIHVQPHFRVALAYKFNVADLSDKPHKGKLSLFQMSTNYH